MILVFRLAILLLLLPSICGATGFRNGGLSISPQQVTSSGGTTTLDLTYGQVIEVTGSANHTIKLPDSNVVKKGWILRIANNSNAVGGITIQDANGTQQAVMPYRQVTDWVLVDDTSRSGALAGMSTPSAGWPISLFSTQYTFARLNSRGGGDTESCMA